MTVRRYFLISICLNVEMYNLIFGRWPMGFGAMTFHVNASICELKNQENREIIFSFTSTYLLVNKLKIRVSRAMFFCIFVGFIFNIHV
jgi:hypothetical protein